MVDVRRGKPKRGLIEAGRTIQRVVREPVETVAHGHHHRGTRQERIVPIDCVYFAVQQIVDATRAGDGVQRISPGFLAGVMEIRYIRPPPGEKLMVQLIDGFVCAVLENVGSVVVVCSETRRR